MQNQKAPTTIPDEDFGKLKSDLLDLRAKAEEMAKSGEVLMDALIDQFPDVARRRPTLFRLVANPDKDMSIPLGMVSILEAQRASWNLDIEDANHKLVTYMCDSTGFEQGKKWLAQAEKERRNARLGRPPSARK